MEEQPIRRSRRLQKLPLPQRQRLDTDGSFKLVGVSEVPGEPKLRTNQEETTGVDIEDLKADEFARNFNQPLTDLNDLVIVQDLSFSSHVVGVL